MLLELFGSSDHASLPPSAGQLMCSCFFSLNAEQGGVTKKVLSALKRPLDFAGRTVTLYLHENDRSFRIM